MVSYRDCSGWAEDTRAVARPEGVAIAAPGYIASQNMAAGPAAAVVRRFSLISLCAAKLVIIIWGAGAESKLQVNLAIQFFHKQVFSPSRYAIRAPSIRQDSSQKLSETASLSYEGACFLPRTIGVCHAESPNSLYNAMESTIVPPISAAPRSAAGQRRRLRESARRS